MKHLLLLLSYASLAGAQTTAPIPLKVPPVSIQTAPAVPGISIVPSAPLVFQTAKTVLIQPEKLEARLQAGYSTGSLTFSVFSEVNTRVTVTASDPRLVIRNGVSMSLPAYQRTSITAVALAPHSGIIRVINAEGVIIATAPYTVEPAKTVNQSLNLNYTPSSNRVSMSYSVSGVPQSPLDVRWNASTNLAIDTETGNVSGGVSVGMSW